MGVFYSMKRGGDGEAWETQARKFLDARGGVCFKTHNVEHADFIRLVRDEHGFPVVECVEAKSTIANRYYPFDSTRKKNQWAGYVYQMERIAKAGFPVVVRLTVKFRRGAGHPPLYWDRVYAAVGDIPHVIVFEEAKKAVENKEKSGGVVENNAGS